MKVVFLEPMAGRDELYVTNEVYDLPNAKAKKLIDGGICIEHSEDVKEVIKVKQAVIGKNAKVSKKKTAPKKK